MSSDLRYLLQNGIPVSAQILAGATYTPVVCAVTIIPAHVQGGEWLYEHHCAQCHEADLTGNPAWKSQLADWEISFILTYVKSKWDINQLNYQHGFMTLTPQATLTLSATPSPPIADTKIP